MLFVFSDVTKLPAIYLQDLVVPEENLEELPTTPNALLFKYFLDTMQDLHDREITLSDTECEELVMLIKQRERDTTT